jgi:hypothetical protein
MQFVCFITCVPFSVSCLQLRSSSCSSGSMVEKNTKNCYKTRLEMTSQLEILGRQEKTEKFTDANIVFIKLKKYFCFPIVIFIIVFAC